MIGIAVLGAAQALVAAEPAPAPSATLSWLEITGIIAGVVTIVSAIITLTRYVTRLQFQVRMDGVELEKSEVEKSVSVLRAEKQILSDELAMARQAGGVASAKKAEIDKELRSLVNLLSAEAGSVYLPLRDTPDSQATGLVFLSIEPITAHTARLRKKIIPLHSLAGRSFSDGNAILVGNAQGSKDHYDKADQVSGYTTQDMMNVPLHVGGTVVGVLQLLNKKGGDRFSEADLARMQELSKTIGARVHEYSVLPNNLELLGVVPDTDMQSATILCCDMTASSLLFQELNVSAAVRHINEYLEELCNVAFRHGATVDKYMGDGVLFRFNVPHPVENHPLAALKAAFEMQGVFEALKKDWLAMGEIVQGIHTRAGIAYGPVQEATVGHPQYQYLTVFGRAVNTAVNLCEIAPRKGSSIVIDEHLYKQTANHVETTELDELGKVQRYANAAYQVDALKA